MLRHPDYEANSQKALEAVDVFKELQDRVYKRLYAEADKSLEQICKLRDLAEDESIRLKASQDVLDRAGFVPIKNVSLSGQDIKVTITPDQVSNIQEAQKLMGDS